MEVPSPFAARQASFFATIDGHARTGCSVTSLPL
jgi:hypothetical protein